MLTQLLYVALGGAIGSVLRALVGMAVTFPLGTLTVNTLGSLAIGVLWGVDASKTPGLHAFMMLGVLGGFTTFSTFSLDVFRLFQDGQNLAAFGYVLGTVALSLVAVFVGFAAVGRLS